jgi:hypothetical protein
MPIDDRLRAGLSANADLLSPPVERHLTAVRRRHQRAVRLRVLAVAAAVALLAVIPWGIVTAVRGRTPDPVAPSTPASLAGSYRVVVEAGGETRSMTGTWTVTLDADGAISLSPPPGFEGPAGDGETYELSGTTFTTNVLIGWPGCQRGTVQVGTYRVAVTDHGAEFTRLEDDCPARIALLGSPWERLP